MKQYLLRTFDTNNYNLKFLIPADKEEAWCELATNYSRVLTDRRFKWTDSLEGYHEKFRYDCDVLGCLEIDEDSVIDVWVKDGYISDYKRADRIHGYLLEWEFDRLSHEDIIYFCKFKGINNDKWIGVGNNVFVRSNGDYKTETNRLWK